MTSDPFKLSFATRASSYIPDAKREKKNERARNIRGVAKLPYCFYRVDFFLTFYRRAQIIINSFSRSK